MRRLLEVRRVLLPKRDAPLSECEDAVAVSTDLRAFAVADGATEGLDSRRWARLLARAWTGARDRGASVGELMACAHALGDRVQDRWVGREVPWYLEEKALLGAFAAFIGVELDEGRCWEATAIGDCCLFVEEGGALVSSFPAASSSEFTSRPTLLPSNHARFTDVAPRVARARGSWSPGRRLVLVSDAIAAWYFDEHGACGEGLRTLHTALDAGDDAAVARLVSEERSARRMRNDDVAVLRVTWIE